MIFYGQQGARQVLKRLLRRNGEDTLEIENSVRQILFDVRANGDSALCKYAACFENTYYDQTPLAVSS